MPRFALRRVVAVVASSAVALGSAAALPQPADAATRYAYGGSAYGSSVLVGQVKLERSSYVPMCTTTTGYSKGANAAGVTLPGIGTIGAVTTRVRSSKSGNTKTSTTVSETAGLNVLGGLVSASAIKTVATASKTKSGYKTTGKTTLTGLSIAGIPVSVTPAKNTTVTIPLVATVTLNEQAPSSKYGNRGISVVGLRIKLFPGNPLGLPTGSIAVGISKASIHSASTAAPTARAYGTQISVGGLLKSGPTAAVYLPCGGSSSSTLTNSVATATSPI